MRKNILCLTVCYFILSLMPLYSSDAVLKEALLLINEGKSEEAVVILKKTVAENPDDANAQLALGVVYLEKNEYESSEKSLKKALELQPQSIPAYYTLAMLYEKQKLYATSIEMWQKVLKLSDNKDLKDLSGKHIKQLEAIK